LQAVENGQTQRASPIGASPVFRVSQPEDYDFLKGLVSQLRREAKDWEAKSDSLETEVLELRRKLGMREQEVMRLQREVHKLKVSAPRHLIFDTFLLQSATNGRT
jgi:predicted RNase H-like nuclease (RuvC/YqgF family)